MNRPKEDEVRREQDQVAYGAELHQIELELQHRALREASHELEEAFARYAELYDAAPVAQLTLDAFGTIRQLNLACAALLGVERRRLEGSPLRAVLDTSSGPAFDAHMRTAVLGRESRSVELILALPGGSSRVVELVTVARLRTEVGAEDVVCHAAMIDVSERRRAEERREQLFRHERTGRLLAESANQTKEDFMAIVSHELRTPLAPIQLWLKALRAGGANEALRARAVEAIEASVKVQVAMIDDLVDVARGRYGQLRIERHPVDLRGIVAAAVEALAPLAAEKMITVDVAFGDGTVSVSGDVVRLRQITSNLLSNAIKYTGEGGRVQVSLRAVGDEVLLAVRDDGEGLEPEMLEAAFEPFRQRGQTRVARHGGLGLGLTIVRQLVDAHDGVVWAESPGRGQGSSFMVRLPRIDPDGMPDGLPDGVVERDGVAASPRTGGPANVAPPLAGVRILIVEDQSATREALGVILQQRGAEVLTAGSADQAWEIAFGSSRPHVIVSDIGLPVEDGFAFMRRLRAHEVQTRAPRVAAIAVTALSTPRDRARALLAGFDRHVTKPIAFEKLVTMIRSLAPGAPPSP